MTWDLQQAYDAYPQIEEAFNADLDVSLHPRGPDCLFDFVAGMGLPVGAAAIDVGAGEGSHAIKLAQRFGFVVTGVDPVARHIEVARSSAAGVTGVTFVAGTAEQLPVADSGTDLVWCRDVLVHVPDLPAVYREFHRVLRPGGRALIYQMCTGTAIDAGDDWFLATMGVIPASADPARIEAAISSAGLMIDERIDLSTEWGEYAQEHGGKPGRKLLHAARLRREKDKWISRYGEAAYQTMMGDCLWHVYAMIGKLTRMAYVLRKPF